MSKQICRLRVVVWSKISNALKRLVFRARDFLAQLVSETSRACTIRVRRSSLGRLWNALGAAASLCHRNSRSRTPVAKRISSCGCVRKTRNRRAVRKMKEDPSEPPCRRRLQTALSCFGPKAAVVNVKRRVSDGGDGLTNISTTFSG